MAAQHFDLFRVMFNPTDWDDTPRRLNVAGRAVRLGWFRTQKPGTVTVVNRNGTQRLTIALLPTGT